MLRDSRYAALRCIVLAGASQSESVIVRHLRMRVREAESERLRERESESERVSVRVADVYIRDATYRQCVKRMVPFRWNSTGGPE